MNRRAVAVLMSVYAADVPDSFLRAISSVISQELPSDVSIRVYLGIDGPVPANLEAAIDSIADKVQAIVRSPTNLGFSAILNRLIAQLTNEELIFRMDADDYSMPKRFIRQIEFMDEHPAIDILGTAMLEVDPHGRTRVVRFPQTDRYIRWYIAYRSPVAHPTVCMRKRVFEVAGNYPPDKVNEDIALWFRCIERGLRFGNLPEPLYQFNIDERFWQRRGKQRAVAEFRAFNDGLTRIGAPFWIRIVPLLRFAFRFMPSSIRRGGYAVRSERSE